MSVKSITGRPRRTATKYDAAARRLWLRVSSLPEGNASSRCSNIAKKRLLTSSPMVKTSSEFAVTSVLANHANPTATMSAPVPFSGLRSHA